MRAIWPYATLLTLGVWAANACSSTARNVGAAGGGAGESGAAGSSGASDGAAGRSVGGAAGDGVAGDRGTGGDNVTATGGSGGEGGAGDACPEGHVLDVVADGCRPVLNRLQPVAVTPPDSSLLEPLVPPLSEEQFSYRIETSFWLTAIRLDVRGPEGSTIEIDGVSAGSATALALDLGANNVEITVETAAGTTTYDVVVHRRAPIRLTAARCTPRTRAG